MAPCYRFCIGSGGHTAAEAGLIHTDQVENRCFENSGSPRGNQLWVCSRGDVTMIYQTRGTLGNTARGFQKAVYDGTDEWIQ